MGKTEGVIHWDKGQTRKKLSLRNSVDFVRSDRMEYQMESGFEPGFSSFDFGYSALFGMGDPFSHPSGSNVHRWHDASDAVQSRFREIQKNVCSRASSFSKQFSVVHAVGQIDCR